MTKATDPLGNNSAEHENDDERAYVEYGEQLRAAVGVALRPWLAAELHARFGIDSSTLVEEVDAVIADADGRLRELIGADVDTPLSGPLERIRGAVEQLGPTLIGLGVVPPTRDPFDIRVRPNDRFALGPVAFSDLGEDVHNAGISWGAAKAYLHQSRRK